MTEAAQRKVHWFDNGVGVYDDHLTEGQRTRYRHCNLHEPAEEQIFLEQIRSLPQQAVYLNIGCAVGYYLILAYQHRTDLQFHAVEPLADHQRFWRENQTLNRIPSEAVTLLPFAISDTNGTARFLEKDYGSALLPPEKSNQTFSTISRIFKQWMPVFSTRTPLDGQSQTVPVRNVTTVPTKTIDELVAQLGGSVDFLQMDIQGLEVAALRGGTHSLESHSIHRLLIGTHSETIHQECESLLHRCGYRISYSEHVVSGQPDGMILAVANSVK